jgi:class 3 adenylate cyclase/DNA-binding beta-propeller fold protein YncE
MRLHAAKGLVITALPTGTVTFLFTDIEGSTRLLKQLGQSYETVLADHQRILRECFAAHEGREVDTQGDSFFVAYSRAGDAVASAAEAQRALAGHRWPEGVEVRVRMGVHTGEPRPTGERYVGFGVHRAARIGAAGHGGQVLLSNATRELIEDELPPDTRIRDLGAFELKDLDRSERLFQLEIEGLPAEFPPLRAPKVAEPRRTRWRLAIGVAALVGASAAAAIAVALTRGDGAPVITPDSVVKIDAESNEIVDVIPVGREPGQVRVVGEYVLVASEAEKTLTRIAARTGDVTTSGLSGADGGLAAGGDQFVWATSLSRARVLRTDVENMLVVDGVSLPRDLGAAFVATGGGSLWVSYGSSPAGVVRYSLPTLQVQRRYSLTLFEAPLEVTYGYGAAWTVIAFASALLRIDAASGETSEIAVGRLPSNPTAGFDSVWTAMAGGDTVWRIDALSQNVASIVKVGDGPFGVAAGAGSVWVANNCEGTVSRIDPATDEAVETIETGYFPRWLDVGHGHVWVGVGGAPFDIDTPVCN